MMLRPATTSEILPLLHGQVLARGVLRVYCLQAERSQCFAFEHEGQVVGFGGFYPDLVYLDCWFMARQGLARPVAMRALIRGLRDELVRRALDDGSVMMVSNVRFDNAKGKKIARMLGFVPGPAHPDFDEVQQWVFPVLNDDV
ncbi:MAG: GNAT family N-acetyltransferase [Hyphomicrobiales bacterium]|nr:GNAT family N-acetyltransferase [Hyphomicrobiales bacterium]